MKKTEAQIKFLVNDATTYVETLEKELTRPAGQNAYHALAKLYAEETDNETEKQMNALIKRYDAACEEVNKRFPS
jgi:hypothetical protein